MIKAMTTTGANANGTERTVAGLGMALVAFTAKAITTIEMINLGPSAPDPAP